MKYIVGFVFILALSFGNSSCQKEFFLDDVDSTLLTLPNLPGVSGSFTAIIDGVKYAADKGYIRFYFYGKYRYYGHFERR